MTATPVPTVGALRKTLEHPMFGLMKVQQAIFIELARLGKGQRVTEGSIRHVATTQYRHFAENSDLLERLVKGACGLPFEEDAGRCEPDPDHPRDGDSTQPGQGEVPRQLDAELPQEPGTRANLTGAGNVSEDGTRPLV